MAEGVGGTSWTTTSPEDRRRLRRVVIAAAIAQAAVNLDFFAMGIALPDMAVDLGTTVTDLQWVVSGYLVALGAFLVAGGRLGDLYGRKSWLIGGMVVFAAASGVAGACSVPALVIGFRIVQGVGAAVAFPVSLAVVTNAFPPDRVQRAVGTVFGIAVAGTALGPFVGGFLTQALSWRYVFWINIPVAAVVVFLIATSVDQSRDETASRKLDIGGLLLIVAGVATITLAFDQASPWGWTSPKTIGLLAVGVALLAAFVLVELRSDHPLLDLSLFRNRVFNSMIVAGTIGNAVYNVVIFGATIYLQQVRSLSPVEAGAVFLALSLGASAAGQVSGRVERFPSWLVMAVALTAGAAGTVGLAFSDQYALYIPMFALTGFGLGLGWAYTSVATQAIVPPAKAGAASGVVLTVLIGVGGIAVTIAASFLETQSGAGLGPAIDDLLRLGAVVALAGAVVAVLTGRMRAASS